MRARASIVIDRPPAEVFTHIADFESHPSWRPEVLTSRTVGAPGVGMTVYQHVSVQGRQALLPLEISEWAPPERISFRYAGPPRVRGGFILRPEGKGTHLTAFATVSVSGKAELVEDRIQSAIESEARRGLGRLKSRIERGAGS